ncbi:unnamed protein product [Litomosoides sigmodontis]|uniref:Uncharacterized protein n=1 Tax=Litomosoides sigmodontis TaxID=42156 RepID=A0A3P6UXG1_LITSI|nr:unnamed protein product [Litomosoides sigmodontis]
MYHCYSGSYRDVSWTLGDTTGAILSALVPGAVGLISCTPYFESDDPVRWWNCCKKPEWAPKSLYTYARINVLTIVPAGYASYFIYKCTDGVSNALRALSLGLCASNLALCFSLSTFITKKDIKGVCYFSIAAHLTAAGSAILAYKHIYFFFESLYKLCYLCYICAEAKVFIRFSFSTANSLSLHVRIKGNIIFISTPLE